MDARIEKALFFMEQHIAEPFSLTQLADAACLSPHHFHRLFKQEMKETPKAYFDRVRMEQIAHMMVVRKDLTITDMAFDYGYSSPAAFTRAFKGTYKMTPRTYRDSVRAQHKERLEQHWASLDEGESFKPQQLMVKHMPAKRLKAKRISMQEELLNQAYRELIAESEDRASHGITIYTEGPFREDRDNVRVHVALDVPADPKDTKGILELRGGYYYQQTVSGPFEAMADDMYKIFQRDIEPSRYKVATTTFYERFVLPNDPATFDYYAQKRTVFGCLVRR